MKELTQIIFGRETSIFAHVDRTQDVLVDTTILVSQHREDNLRPQSLYGSDKSHTANLLQGHPPRGAQHTPGETPPGTFRNTVNPPIYDIHDNGHRSA